MTTAGMTALGRAEEFLSRPLSRSIVDRQSVVVVSIGRTLIVAVNRCPHQQAEMLHEGSIDHGGLTCPVHGRTFDLADGRCRNGAGRLTFVPSMIVDAVLWAGPVPVPEFPSF